MKGASDAIEPTAEEQKQIEAMQKYFAVAIKSATLKKTYEKPKSAQIDKPKCDPLDDGKPAMKNGAPILDAAGNPLMKVCAKPGSMPDWMQARCAPVKDEGWLACRPLSPNALPVPPPTSGVKLGSEQVTGPNVATDKLAHTGGQGNGPAPCDPLYDGDCHGHGDTQRKACDNIIPRKFCSGWAGNNMFYFKTATDLGFNNSHRAGSARAQADGVWDSGETRFVQQDVPVQEMLPGGVNTLQLLDSFGGSQKKRFEGDFVPFVVELYAQKELQQEFLRTGSVQDVIDMAARLKSALSCFQQAPPSPDIEASVYAEVGGRALAKIDALTKTMTGMMTDKDPAKLFDTSEASKRVRSKYKKEMGFAGQCMSVVGDLVKARAHDLGLDIKISDKSVDQEVMEGLDELPSDVQQALAPIGNSVAIAGKGTAWVGKTAVKAAAGLTGVLVPLKQVKRMALIERSKTKCGGLQQFSIDLSATPEMRAMQEDKIRECKDILTEFLAARNELNELGGNYGELKSGMYDDGPHSVTNQSRFKTIIDPRIKNYRLNPAGNILDPADSDSIYSCMKHFRKNPRNPLSELDSPSDAARAATDATLKDAGKGHSTSINGLRDLCDPKKWGDRARDILTTPSLAGAFYNCDRKSFSALKRNLGDTFAGEGDSSVTRKECLDSGNFTLLACQYMRNLEHDEKVKDLGSNMVAMAFNAMEQATPVMFGASIGAGSASIASQAIGTGVGVALPKGIEGMMGLAFPEPTADDLRAKARFEAAACANGHAIGSTGDSCETGLKNQIEQAAKLEKGSWGTFFSNLSNGRVAQASNDLDVQSAVDTAVQGWLGAKLGGAHVEGALQTKKAFVKLQNELHTLESMEKMSIPQNASRAELEAHLLGRVRKALEEAHEQNRQD